MVSQTSVNKRLFLSKGETLDCLIEAFLFEELNSLKFPFSLGTLFFSNVALSKELLHVFREFAVVDHVLVDDVYYSEGFPNSLYWLSDLDFIVVDDQTLTWPCNSNIKVFKFNTKQGVLPINQRSILRRLANHFAFFPFHILFIFRPLVWVLLSLRLQFFLSCLFAEIIDLRKHGFLIGVLRHCFIKPDVV